MQKKLLASVCLIALAGCDSGSGTSTDAGTNTIIQTDQANLVDPIPGPAAAAALTTLPGRIEAEDFTSQNGIRLGDTNDSGNTQFVGHIENNDYTQYDIDVPTSGTYDLLARVGSLRNNATVNVVADDRNAGWFNVSPTGGWAEWETVSTTVNLSKGQQTLRLQFSGNANGLMNINWFSLALHDGNTPAPQPEPTPTGTDIELSSAQWTVTANRNSDNAFLAIDGNDNTRWTTGQAQSAGQQFTIDLNSIQIFDRLILDSSDSSGDYPRNYEVEVSNNGSQWSTVAAGTGTTNGLTVIDFADQNASHVRISQLGSASRNWWSIHELTLFANSSDAQPAPPPTELPPTEQPPTEPTSPTEPSPAPGPSSNCGATELQECVNDAASNGGGTIVLGSGTYLLEESLILESNITIRGQGSSTVITFADSVADSINEPLVHRSQAGNGIRNVTVEDVHLLCTVDTTDRNDRDRTDMLGFFIDGAGDANNPGSLQHHDITLRNVEVSKCGSIGIHIKGVSGLDVIDIDAHDNGWGPTDLWHNMYFLRVHDIRVIQTSPNAGGYTDSPSGHGLRMAALNNVYFEGLVVTGNADHGLHMNDVVNLRGHNLTIEGNCAIPNGLCRPISCFGTCDFDLDARKEN